METIRHRLASLVDLAPTAILIFLVLGSIYTGIATPTESAAMGVAGAIVLGLVDRKLTLRMLHESLRSTARTTSMIALILFGAYFLNYIMSSLGVPQMLASFLTGLPSRYPPTFVATTPREVIASSFDWTWPGMEWVVIGPIGSFLRADTRLSQNPQFIERFSAGPYRVFERNPGPPPGWLRSTEGATSTGPISAAGPNSTTRTPSTSAAAHATSAGPRSAPLTSTATVTVSVLVVVIVLMHVHDLATGVEPAVRAHAVRPAGPPALRAGVHRGRGDLVLRPPLRGARVRLLLLRDGHVGAEG